MEYGWVIYVIEDILEGEMVFEDLFIVFGKVFDIVYYKIII